MTNFDRWLTTTPEDRAHKDTCNCEQCHQKHIDDGVVLDNALSFPLDYQCCVDEVEGKIDAGEMCEIHPRSYCEPGYCEACAEEEFEKQKKKAV